MTLLVPAAFFIALSLIGCGAGDRHAAAPDAVAHERADDLFRAGRSAAARGDTVRAEQYLSAAIERGYDRGKALPLLLEVCLSSSRLRAALAHAEPYLRNHPEDDALRYIVAIVHMGLGKPFEARLDLDELLRHDRRNAEAHLLLGILDSRTDADAAQDHFRTYLELEPQGAHAGEARSRLAELAVLDEERKHFARGGESSGEAERRDGGPQNHGSVPQNWHELHPPAEDADENHEGLEEGTSP